MEEKRNIFFPLCTRAKFVFFLCKFPFIFTGTERAPHYCQVEELDSRFTTWPSKTPERERPSLLLSGVGVLASNMISTEATVLTLHHSPSEIPSPGHRRGTSLLQGGSGNANVHVASTGRDGSSLLHLL